MTKPTMYVMIDGKIAEREIAEREACANNVRLAPAQPVLYPGEKLHPGPIPVITRS